MKTRLFGVGSLVAVSLAFVGSRSARALNSSRPGLELSFAAPGTQIRIEQQIVAPDIVAPDIVAPDRVMTIASLQCNTHSLRIAFSTTSSAGAEAAQGAALAALLGFMQGLSAAEIARIVAPDVPVSIVAPDLQLRGGAFESAHVFAVAAQLETAMVHLAIDTPPTHVNQTFAAYQSASAALGAAVACGTPSLVKGP